MKRISAYKAKFEFLAGGTFGQGPNVGRNWSGRVRLNFPAGNRNPGLNRDGPDGFLAGFRGGRRPTYRGGLGGRIPPYTK